MKAVGINVFISDKFIWAFYLIKKPGKWSQDINSATCFLDTCGYSMKGAAVSPLYLGKVWVKIQTFILIQKNCGFFQLPALPERFSFEDKGEVIKQHRKLSLN